MIERALRMCEVAGTMPAFSKPFSVLLTKITFEFSRQI